MRISAAFGFLLLAGVHHATAQNVGIGETAPAAKLEIKGSASTLLNSLLVKDGSNIPLLTVSNMGRVGINTSNPLVPLHVTSSYTSEMMRVRGVNPYISFYNETDLYSGYLWMKGNGMELGTPSGSILPVTIAPGLEVAATFKPGGYVGIGVDNPQYRLDVNGRVLLRHNGESSGIWFNNSSNSYAPGFVGLASDNEIGFYGTGGFVWGMRMNTNTGNSIFSNNVNIGGAVTSSSFNFSTPRTYHYSINPVEFSAAHSTDEVRNDYDVEGVYMTNSTTGLRAPVHLPQGATITSFTVYLMDASAMDMQVTLWRRSIPGSLLSMCSLTNTGNPGRTGLTATSITQPAIDNSLYTYYISAKPDPAGYDPVWTGSWNVIYGVHIIYTMTQAQ